MAKKVLLLVLCLPIIIMICLFTTTDAVSLAIDIPVTGIEIVEDNIVYLDLDEQETYKIDYTVYPTNATKKDVAMSYEAVGDSRLAKLKFNDEGEIVPESMGMAKVFLTTIDGGFKDSFIVQIDSNMLHEINSEISADEIHVGGEALITNEFIPHNAKNQIVAYESSDSKVATVDNRGKVTGVGKGTATIKIYSPENQSIYDEVTISVFNTGVMDLSTDKISTWDRGGRFNASIDCDTEYTLSYRILDRALNPITTSDLTVTFGEEDAQGNVEVIYEFAPTFVGELNLEVTITTELGATLTKVVNLKRVDKVTMEFDYLESPVYAQGSTNMMFVTLNPSNAEVTYEVSTTNDNISVQEMDGIIIVNALKAGTSEVKVKAKVAGVDETLESSQEVIISPSKFNINEISKTYGIEGTWTVAGKNYDNATKQLTTANYKVNLSYGKQEDVADNFLTYVSYEVVDKAGNALDVLEIDGDGNFKVKDFTYVGEAFIRAVFKVGDKKIKTSEPLKVMVVGNGVNVDSYEDLLAITKQNLPVVLTESVEDFGLYEDGSKMPVENTYTEMWTTYDWTYYKNLKAKNPEAKDPLVKILIEFNNNVYGNGYTINAHNIAYGLDEAGALKEDALFRGPLDFVGITESGVGAISVKGQDNISFAVYENVTISNVELKGCNLLAESDGTYDLNDLNYVGTVVEVMGDNVNIEFSRITNGRTGLRVFGDKADPDKVIHLNISNSILSGAREFIIRMGSNKFIEGGRNPETCAPYIPGSEGTSFPVYPSYVKMNAEQRKAYDEKYIKTFVTVKNSAFKDCGIFSIGIDSHFSGGVLANGSNNMIFKDVLPEGIWLDLAKTSYGAKLTFDGDVRIYDWKQLDSVDSSTLIEILKLDGTGKDLFNKMELKVVEMVKKVASDPKYANILYSDPSYKEGKEYVHGGVAFFGGGKNYGVFEQINSEKSFAALNGYQITLAQAGRTELQLAAGEEPFYFLMHDKTTINFTPKTQEELLSSEEGYAFVYER